MKYYDFEISKLQKILLPLFILTFVTQLFSTYFFAIVGRFDSNGGDDLLQSYPAVLGLASTITLCVVAIYGAVIISRYIVKNYVGENKNRVFLYPIKRSYLYLIKNLTFAFILGGTQFLALLFSNTLFFVGEFFFPIMEKPITNYLLNLGLSTMVCVLLTLSIIFFSSLVGIYFSSMIYTVVTSIVSVVVVANISAMSLINFQLIAFFGALGILSVVLLLLLNMGKGIDKSEAI